MAPSRGPGARAGASGERGPLAARRGSERLLPRSGERLPRARPGSAVGGAPKPRTAQPGAPARAPRTARPRCCRPQRCGPGAARGPGPDGGTTRDRAGRRLGAEPRRSAEARPTREGGADGAQPHPSPLPRGAGAGLAQQPGRAGQGSGPGATCSPRGQGAVSLPPRPWSGRLHRAPDTCERGALGLPVLWLSQGGSAQRAQPRGS